MFKIFKRKSNEKPNSDKSFDQYESGAPNNQRAIDALPGWNSAFPAEFGLSAGNHHLYADPRIDWAIQCYGSIADRKILEIGPLEGMHTFRLNQERPALLDAVEANRLCFLRCLITKQILGIDRATFYLGDIQGWLRGQRETYDLAIASGVLYHMPDPAEFLRCLAGQTNAIYIWTHYFHDESMPPDDVRRSPFSGVVEQRRVEGLDIRYYERHYQAANTNASFCGGMKDKHFWMHREDILSLLRRLGFGELIIAHDEPSHSGGPCFSIFARRVEHSSDAAVIG